MRKDLVYMLHLYGELIPTQEQINIIELHLQGENPLPIAEIIELWDEAVRLHFVDKYKDRPSVRYQFLSSLKLGLRARILLKAKRLKKRFLKKEPFNRTQSLQKGPYR